MRFPALRGVIDRRILINFRLDPTAVRRVLPHPFRPRLVHGYAIGGICLMRLKDLRPRRLPGLLGLKSENGTIRFAVQWEQDGEVKEGVYISRRITNSRWNLLAGGRLFPGVHDRGRFSVQEKHPYYTVALESNDRTTRVRVKGTVSDRLPKNSLFGSVDEASDFFRAGSLGYSDARTPGVFEGVKLHSPHWRVSPLDVSEVESNLFGGRNFPSGAAAFECALLMRGAEHEWHGCEPLYAGQLEIAEAA